MPAADAVGKLSGMSENARLEALELAVARLTKEMVALRSEVQRLGGGGENMGAGAGTGGPPQQQPSRAAPVSPSPIERQEQPFVSDELRRLAAGASLGSVRGTTSPGSRSAPARGAAASWTSQRGDLERLIGRYGTLALAALTILMGVGAFLSWAVRNGVIGPEMRVALGALTAVVIAGIGLRLRRGQSPRFGDVLLALSLAIVHVVSWGAGPLLHLVPDGVALAVAGIASAALAALSLREEDQSLFNIGFGGALIAPFVTSSGDGNPLLLLLYGAVVLAAGMHAMRDREWGKTPLVKMLGIAVYTAVTTEQLMRAPEWTRATAPALFAIAVAWLALILVKGRPRSRVAHVALVAALGSLGALQNEPSSDWPRVVLALVVTISGFASVTTNERTVRSKYLVALAIPWVAVAIALSTLPRAANLTGAVLAALWAIASAGAGWLNRDGEREAHAFSATIFAGLALALPVWNSSPQFALRLAALGSLGAALLPRIRLRGVATALLVWLSLGALFAFDALSRRTDYMYRPFLTKESLGAAAMAAAWILFSWFASRSVFSTSKTSMISRGVIVRLLGAAVTFLWIHQELAGAYSRDVATFLLVAYYAVTGIVAIGVGRWRALPLLRQLGLALSVLAAIKAMAEASSLEIGWRVGGYMLAGLFLLGVAYWYRASGRGEGDGTEREAAPATEGEQRVV